MTILTYRKPVNRCALPPEKRAGDAKGELGIRHEDTVAVTESGCENLCPKWSGTPEDPAVV
jgi:hypothetical protein